MNLLKYRFADGTVVTTLREAQEQSSEKGKYETFFEFVEASSATDGGVPASDRNKAAQLRIASGLRQVSL